MPGYRRDEGAMKGEFWFMTAPSIATHNSTYVHVSRHHERAGEPRLCMAPGDAERLGVEEGGMVRVWNEQGELRFVVAVDERMPVGMVRRKSAWTHSGRAVVARSQSWTSRPRSKSRVQPPTIHARSSASRRISQIR